MSNIAVIIVAAGSGNRMKNDIPKQFLPLDGKPILVHTLCRVIDVFPRAEIVVVISRQEQDRWAQISKEYGLTDSHRVCFGGATRFESVRNAVGMVDKCEFIAVHDGVRPLFSRAMVQRLMECVERCGTAIPVIKAVDSYRMIIATGSSVVDRERLRAVQTPQVFSAKLLKKAYSQTTTSLVTDDASLVEMMGTEIALCEGETTNIKITTPIDIIYATEILRNSVNL